MFAAPLWGCAGGSACWGISDLVVVLDGADAMFPAQAYHICCRRDGQCFSVPSTTWRLILACDIRKFLFTEGRVQPSCLKFPWHQYVAAEELREEKGTLLQS